MAQVQSDVSSMYTGREEATVGAIGPPENKQSTEGLLKAEVGALGEQSEATWRPNKY